MMKRLFGLIALFGCGQALANTCTIRQAGATDQTVYVEFIDSTTGVPNSGLAYNTSGIDIEYVRAGAAAVDITEATQTAAGAHSDGGFVSVGHGRYRLDLPDAAVAAGVPEVVIQGVITGYIMLPCAVALSPAVNTVAVAGTAQTANDIGADVDAILVDTGTTLDDLVDDLESRLGTPSNLGGGATVAGNLADIEGQTDDIGAAGAGLTAIDLPNQTMDISGTITTATNVTTVNGIASGAITATAIAADAIGASEIAAGAIAEDAFDTTAGSFKPLGIVDQGTAQSATSTTLVLRSALAMADDTAIGMTLVACGSTQGYCQARAVTDYVLSTDTATVDTWTVTPSGTVTYYLFGTAPGGSGGGLDAAGVRAAVGLATANLDTQLAAIDDAVDTEVAAILADTNEVQISLAAGGLIESMVDDLQAEVDGIQADTEDLQARVPAALVGGRIDATVDGTGMEAGAVTAIQSGLATASSISALNNLSAAQVNSEVDTALADIHLDHLLATTYDPASKPGAADALLNELVESDAGVSRYTVNALENAPSGSGASAATIADAVWDELIAGHAVSGSTGEALSAAGAAGDPWITALPGSYTSGQAGYIIGTNLNATVSSRASQTSVDTVDDLLDTEVGALTTELAKVPKSDSNVTFNATALASINAQADLALSDYDPPTRAELTTDTNSVLTAVGDVPTNAELATSQAAADDATLAAIAALNNLSAANVRDIVIEDQGSGVSLACALAVITAYAAGDLVTSGSTSTYEDPSGTETRITGTVASAGNRTASVTCPSF